MQNIRSEDFATSSKDMHEREVKRAKAKVIDLVEIKRNFDAQFVELVSVAENVIAKIEHGECSSPSITREKLKVLSKVLEDLYNRFDELTLNFDVQILRKELCFAADVAAPLSDTPVLGSNNNELLRTSPVFSGSVVAAAPSSALRDYLDPQVPDAILLSATGSDNSGGATSLKGADVIMSAAANVDVHAMFNDRDEMLTLFDPILNAERPAAPTTVGVSVASAVSSDLPALKNSCHEPDDTFGGIPVPHPEVQDRHLKILSTGSMAQAPNSSALSTSSAGAFEEAARQTAISSMKPTNCAVSGEGHNDELSAYDAELIHQLVSQPQTIHVHQSIASILEKRQQSLSEDSSRSTPAAAVLTVPGTSQNQTRVRLPVVAQSAESPRVVPLPPSFNESAAVISSTNNSHVPTAVPAKPKAPDLTLKEKYEVVVTWVVDPSYICVQLARDNIASKLSAELTKWYDSNPDALYRLDAGDIKEGLFCGAPYKDEGGVTFYRAVVTRLENNVWGDFAWVHYVDWGNVEVVHVQVLRKLKPEVVVLPCQSFVFSLIGLAPSDGLEWSNMECEVFKDRLLHWQNITNTLVATPHSYNVDELGGVRYCVDFEVGTAANSVLTLSDLLNDFVSRSCGVLSTTGTDYNAFSSPSYVKAIRSPKFPEGEPEAWCMYYGTPWYVDDSAATASLTNQLDQVPPVAVEVPVAATSHTGNVVYQSLPLTRFTVAESLRLQVNNDSQIKFVISHIENPGKFYVRCYDQTPCVFETLRKLEAVLHSVYSSPSGRQLPTLDVSVAKTKPYVVYEEVYADANERKFFRGIVTEVFEKGMPELQTSCACVFLVDNGETILAPLHQLRVLNDVRLTEVPRQAVECKLFQIEPTDLSGEWSKNATQFFINLCNVVAQYRALVCDTNGSKYALIMFANDVPESGMTETVNELLVRKQIARATADNS